MSCERCPCFDLLFGIYAQSQILSLLFENIIPCILMYGDGRVGWHYSRAWRMMTFVCKKQLDSSWSIGSQQILYQLFCVDLKSLNCLTTACTNKVRNLARSGIYCCLLCHEGPAGAKFHRETTTFFAEIPPFRYRSTAACTLSNPLPTTIGSGDGTNVPFVIALGRYSL